MMLALLIWFLACPHIPGNDRDALLVARPLRHRVIRLLFPSLLRAVAAWLLGCAAGAFLLVLAVLCRAPPIAVLGPAAAALGAMTGVGILLRAIFRERVWVRALGLPVQWRGPWLAGSLAKHMAIGPPRPITVPTAALTPLGARLSSMR
jgi:hypothetical protein